MEKGGHTPQWPIPKMSKCKQRFIKHYTESSEDRTRRTPLNNRKGKQFLSSSPVFSGVHVTRSLVLCVCVVDPCLSFCTFSFGHVLSVLLRFTDSDFRFGIFKLFLKQSSNIPQE